MDEKKVEEEIEGVKKEEETETEEDSLDHLAKPGSCEPDEDDDHSMAPVHNLIHDCKAARIRSYAALIGSIGGVIVACSAFWKPRDDRATEMSYETTAQAIKELSEESQRQHDDLVALRAYLDGFVHGTIPLVTPSDAGVLDASVKDASVKDASAVRTMIEQLEKQRAEREAREALQHVQPNERAAVAQFREAALMGRSDTPLNVLPGPLAVPSGAPSISVPMMEPAPPPKLNSKPKSVDPPTFKTVQDRADSL